MPRSACTGLLPDPGRIEREGVEAAYAARYAEWKESGGHDRLFRRISLAAPRGDILVLRDLDPHKAVIAPVDWPSAWEPIRERLTARLLRAPTPGGPMGGGFAGDTVALIDLPRFGSPNGRLGPGEQGWLLVELDLDYIRTALLPDLVQRHLGADGRLDYYAEVITRTTPPAVIYQSDSTLGGHADASVSLFEVRHDQINRRSPRVTPPGGVPIRAGDAGSCWRVTAPDPWKRLSHKRAGATWLCPPGFCSWSWPRWPRCCGSPSRLTSWRRPRWILSPESLTSSARRSP